MSTSSHSSSSSISYHGVPDEETRTSRQSEGIEFHTYRICTTVNLNPWPENIRRGHFELQPSLPSGLSFNNTTGLISGTPRMISPRRLYRITLQYEVPLETRFLYKNFYLRIDRNGFDGPVTKEYNFSYDVNPLCNNYERYSYSAEYPSGYTWLNVCNKDDNNECIEEVSGSTFSGPITISGTPPYNAPSSISITIRATYRGNDESIRIHSYVFVVSLQVNDNTSPEFTNRYYDNNGNVVEFDSNLTINIYEPVNIQFPNVEYGEGDYRFTISPELPEGLKIKTHKSDLDRLLGYDNNRGFIVGLVSNTQPRTRYTITVSDADEKTDSDSDTLVITLTIVSRPVFLEVNQKTSFHWKALTHVRDIFPPATGGNATIEYSITPISGYSESTTNGLPAGVEFRQKERLLVGTPRETISEGVFRLTATDSNGDTDSYDFRILVDIGLFGDEDRELYFPIGRSFQYTVFTTHLDNLRVVSPSGGYLNQDIRVIATEFRAL